MNLGIVEVEPKTAVSRRQFLFTTAAAAGGLMLGFHLPGLESAEARAASALHGAVFAPNAWVRVSRDGRVTLMLAHSEMGQGVMTALPTLIAEELGVDPREVTVEMAPADKAYGNPLLGGAQVTGGSTSVRSSWEPLRQAGAVARTMLVEAAARRWNVPAAKLRVERGHVLHPDGKQRASFGELAAAAAGLKPPTSVKLKDPSQFVYIGKPLPRLDTEAKVTGRAQFGIDVKVPGMMVAAVARCPVFGGTVRRFDDSKARAIKGVHRVVKITSGVAVVADDFWTARKGAEALEIEWDYHGNEKWSDRTIAEFFRREAKKPGALARAEGDAEAVLRKAPAERRIEAVYEVPFLAHSAMEPLAATARIEKGRCDVWAPTQGQTWAQNIAAQVTGLPPEKCFIHTTFLGGGFGRKVEFDFVRDAVETAKAVGRPVKVIWSREDVTQHDVYRPATYNELAATLDEAGNPIAWHHKIVGPSIFARVRPHAIKDGIDRTSVEGARDIAYKIPNLKVEYVMANTPVPVGFWRSVGHSQNTFIVESFIDELAHRAKQDPFEFRRRLLSDAPRHRRVLERAAREAGWGKAAPPGIYRGIAVGEAYGSYVAEVAEVSVKEGQVTVHRVVAAIDCGHYVNPGIIEAQIESGIAYGLTAALFGRISLAEGRVRESNFDRYPLLRLNQMPRVEVHIEKNNEAPGGVGETGVPTLAPAVCNAIFAATGKRIRSLPITL